MLRKLFLSAAVIGALSTPAHADWQNGNGHRHGNGNAVAAAIVGGMALGLLGAQSVPAYTANPVYQPATDAFGNPLYTSPAYGAATPAAYIVPGIYPRCGPVRQPVTDIYGAFVGYRIVRVCN